MPMGNFIRVIEAKDQMFFPSKGMEVQIFDFIKRAQDIKSP